MYGEDARLHPNCWSHLGSRPIEGVGRGYVRCPANRLEQFVEKLRETYGVTIASFDYYENKHIRHSLPVLLRQYRGHRTNSEF